MSKAGRYGGTYAHKDIAFEFGMWISPKFKLLLIKEFERLKAEEQKQIGQNAKRELSKINYRIHTDAIKQNLIPNELTKEQINYVYAEEADVLNMALFGMTAKEWRNKNKNLDGNIRDHATINELICLANLENLNSVFINDGLNQSERLVRLNKIAISQMKILNETDIKYLKSKQKEVVYLSKYLKVMFGTKSGASDFEYKLGEVNVAKIWNPKELDPKKMGGFNFSTESKILRWLVRGDTIYDVELPEDAEVVDCPSNSAPHGVFRSNKIIISNPRTVTDDIAMELYLKSDLPEKSYYKAMAGCAVRGYMNTALKIFEDKVNKENVRLVTLEFEDFCKQGTEKQFDENKHLNEQTRFIYNKLKKLLQEILEYG